ASWIASREPRVMSTTRADAIAVLTVDECDRLVERRPARPSVTHRDVLIPDRHATEEDDSSGGDRTCATVLRTCDHAICGQLCSPSARSSSMTVCRYMPTSAHWGRPRSRST